MQRKVVELETINKRFNGVPSMRSFQENLPALAALGQIFGVGALQIASVDIGYYDEHLWVEVGDNWDPSQMDDLLFRIEVKED